MGSPEAWFREQFNLAPTDDRYLNATPSDIRVEFYLHFLRNRLAVARQKKIEIRSLDDLLGPITMEEKEEATEKMLAEKKQQQQPEDIITFRAVKR